jgi:SAM-dependent methyltransferase
VPSSASSPADRPVSPARGAAFNAIARDYERHRPPYPDTLVDGIFATAGLGAGDHVLEVGCGTGQLTRSLLARGLSVTAVEPGDQLIAVAREQLGADADATFLNARLEDANLAAGQFRAAFAAASIHWVDPDVSWRTLADVLAPGGTLALVQHCGLTGAPGDDDRGESLAILERIAPAAAAAWPAYRNLHDTIAGAQARRANVSEVWSWLGSYDLARDEAAGGFEPARISVLPAAWEHTADELTAALGTLSFWADLSPQQRAAIATENRALVERLGRPVRSTTAACAVTARRADRQPATPRRPR